MNEGSYLNVKQNKKISDSIVKGLLSGCSSILMFVLISQIFSVNLNTTVTMISSLLVFGAMYFFSVRYGKLSSLFVTAIVLLVIVFRFSDFVNGFYITLNSIMKLYSNKNAEIISLISVKKSDPSIFFIGFFTLFSTLKILLDSKLFNCIIMFFSMMIVAYFGCAPTYICVAYFLFSFAEIFFSGGNMASFVLTVVAVFSVAVVLSMINFDSLVSDLSVIKNLKNKFRYELSANEIEIVMEKPQPLYLKENSERPECELYNFSDDFYWLYKNNFFPQKQASLITDTTDTKNTSKITVNVKRGKKKIFTTYGIINSDSLSDNTNSIDGKFINDSGNSTYSFTVNNNYISQQNNEYSTLQKNIKNTNTDHYLSIEQVYRNYCYKAFTSLSDDQRELIKNHLENYVEQNLNIAKVKSSILSFIQNNITYDHDGKKTDDFSLSDILEKSCYANEYDYAVITQKLFRFYNVPARICKGYMVTPDMTNSLSEYSAVTITKNNRHTWCEYYLDGVGWLPFETCPDYLGMIKTDDAFYSDKTAKDTSVSHEKQKPEKEQTIDNEKTADEVKEKNNKILYPIFLTPFAVVILMGVFQRAKLSARLIKIKKQPNRQQAKSLYLWAFSLIRRIVPYNNSTPDIYSEMLKRNCSKEISDCYKKAEKVYEKILFSQLEISENELGYVRDLFVSSKDLSDQKLSWAKKFILKFILGKY